MHLSFREAIDRVNRSRSVVQQQQNHAAMARALADVGLVAHGVVEPFDRVQERTREALQKGLLCLVPATRTFRPICDSFEIDEAEPLVDPAPEAVSAAPEEAGPAPWPGDAAAQAEVLTNASIAGTPFCEVCENQRSASA